MLKGFLATIAALTLVGSAPSLAAAKSTGGCPPGAGAEWFLVTVESLGLDPEVAGGIPSLDGNGDGLTCARYPYQPPNVLSLTIFRDNTA